MIIIEYEERRSIVYPLIEAAKENKLNEQQKARFYNVVKNLETGTEQQKERFLIFYNLELGQTQNYRLCDLSRKFNCSSSAIRFSIFRIRNRLVNSNDETLLILKKILEDYE